MFTLSTFADRDGAVAGEHEVLVSPPPYQGDRDDIKRVPQVVADKYQHFSTSGLRFTVEPSGDNRFEIVVERSG